MKFTDSCDDKFSFQVTSWRIANWKRIVTKFKIIRSSYQRCSVLFIKKETLAQVFSCEFYETSKNTFYTEHLCPTASGF